MPPTLYLRPRTPGDVPRACGLVEAFDSQAWRVMSVDLRKTHPRRVQLVNDRLLDVLGTRFGSQLQSLLVGRSILTLSGLARFLTRTPLLLTLGLGPSPMLSGEVFRTVAQKAPGLRYLDMSMGTSTVGCAVDAEIPCFFSYSHITTLFNPPILCLHGPISDTPGPDGPVEYALGSDAVTGTCGPLDPDHPQQPQQRRRGWPALERLSLIQIPLNTISFRQANAERRIQHEHDHQEGTSPGVGGPGQATTPTAATATATASSPGNPPGRGDPTAPSDVMLDITTFISASFRRDAELMPLAIRDFLLRAAPDGGIPQPEPPPGPPPGRPGGHRPAGHPPDAAGPGRPVPYLRVPRPGHPFPRIRPAEADALLARLELTVPQDPPPVPDDEAANSLALDITFPPMHGLRSLRYLTIRETIPCLISLDPGSFGALTRLVYLDLSYNRMQQLPSAIGLCTQLRWIDVSHNHLTMLPSTIGDLGRLQTLLIGNNPLRALPTTVGRLRALWWLEADNLQLQRLPDEIGELKALVRLTVFRNTLTALPDTIGECSALRTIWAAQNRLTELPDTIGRLKVLRTLWLERNQLQRLPATLGDCTQLRRLALAHNPLATLPPALARLVHCSGRDQRGYRGFTYTHPDITVPPKTVLEGPAAVIAFLQRAARAADQEGGTAQRAAAPVQGRAFRRATRRRP